MAVTYQKMGYNIKVELLKSAAERMDEGPLAVVKNIVAAGMAVNVTTKPQGLKTGTHLMVHKIREDLEEEDSLPGTWHVILVKDPHCETNVSVESDMFARFRVIAEPLGQRPSHESQNARGVRVLVYSTE